MTRHFLTQRYAPSDVNEMSALLEDEIRSVGFQIVRTPPHEAASTADEVSLAHRLADPRTGNVAEPRVEHDVDCIAGVLTMRHGHRSTRLENARAVFVTSSRLVIQSTREWWEEDEREASVPPIVHLRALANLAWLKRPRANPEYQLRDLIALCSAAMRPSQRTWQTFTKHLHRLNRQGTLTDDQIIAIIASSISDTLLRRAEIEYPDGADVDADTLDEVVSRVMAEYREEADRRVQEAEGTAAAAMAALRDHEEAVEERARDWAQRIIGAAYWVGVLLVLLGSSALVVRNSLDGGLLGVMVGLALLLLVILETIGFFGQLRSARAAGEAWLGRRLQALLTSRSTGDSRVRDE